MTSHVGDLGSIYIYWKRNQKIHLELDESDFNVGIPNLIYLFLLLGLYTEWGNHNYCKNATGNW